MITLVVKEERELEHVARELLAVLRTKERTPVLALKGDLGAGKTALTKALARVTEIKEHVTSPTFVIMKSYDIPHDARFRTLTHIDAYRIESEEELTVLGWNELIGEPHRLLVIEWPERVNGLVPKDALNVNIVIGKEGERIITYGD